MVDIVTCEEQQRPGYFTKVPGRPAVSVGLSWPYSGDRLGIVHYGWPEDLIAADVATAVMLASYGAGRPPRGVRLDADGDYCSVTRSLRSRDGVPAHYLRISREKRRELLGRLPGALEAIAAHEAYERWKVRRDEQLARSPRACTVLGLPQPTRAPAQKPVLRLVVDNTREPRP